MDNTDVALQASRSTDLNQRVRKYLVRIQSLPQHLKTTIIISTDALISVAVLFLSTGLLLSLDFSTNLNFLAYIATAVGTVFIYHFCGMYGQVLRYASLSDYPRITVAAVFSGLLVCVAAHYIGSQNFNAALWLTYSFGLLLATSAVRLCWSRIQDRKPKPDTRTVVAIYGAGLAGQQALQLLRKSGRYLPKYWLDDNPELHDRLISQRKVLNPHAPQTKQILKQDKVGTILVAIPSLNTSDAMQLFKRLNKLNIPVRALPSFRNALEKHGLSNVDVQSLDIDYLIGRKVVPPTPALLSKNTLGKNILVTGAGGSVGSELCRQIARLNPSRLVLFDNNEPSLYNVHMQLTESAQHSTDYIPLLGSVLDRAALQRAIKDYSIDTFYHAAAYKHVPLVESNPSAGAMVNIFGTRNAVETALENNVGTFVQISTDKAVRPSSMMGATKRVAEMLIQSLADKYQESGTTLSMVRFGNVIGSSGSVIPRFLAQISNGGPVTVTDKHVNRFFMTIPEAAQLVIQAGGLARNGDVLLLDMGKPVMIDDLAKALIHISGLTCKDAQNLHGSIEITYTGLRPGEKLTEELLIDSDAIPTEHDKIVKAREHFLAFSALEPVLESISDAIESNDKDQLRALIFDLALTERDPGKNERASPAPPVDLAFAPLPGKQPRATRHITIAARA